ncbi:Holliday junction resolvase-like protein [Spiroplasma sabaudiense Ar-1343]|uniref:Putative pre-16S rRNA nuclease n=1 Tax=Spiroplasma sabaudiense Ar-1343 TaxID=1276257 RepID=W6AIM5_9MOLU|nr:Holliday junction resolvase RuvX [Spiroplasma sabaudiense]AHI53559.1 Holliday junction resolvase-like protein [Spiroplasma sabaudiense Ar-1343]
MEKYIGLDLGSKTIGVAISSGIIANPLGTIRFEEYDFETAANMLHKYLEENQISIIVIGYPINMNNSIGHRAEMVDYFIEVLTTIFPKWNSTNVVRVDERLTTRMAKAIMIKADLSRKKQKENKDGLAAQLILETYLTQIANKNLKNPQ